MEIERPNFEALDYDGEDGLNKHFFPLGTGMGMYSGSHPHPNANIQDEYTAIRRVNPAEDGPSNDHQADLNNSDGNLSPSDEPTAEMFGIVNENHNNKGLTQGACNNVGNIASQFSSTESAGLQNSVSTQDTSASRPENQGVIPFGDQSMNNTAPINAYIVDQSAENTVASDPSNQSKSAFKNAKKNHPVLIVNRVKRSLLDCIDSEYTGPNGRLDYVWSVLDRFGIRADQQKKIRFKKFLNSLHFGDGKSWKNIKDALHKSPYKDAGFVWTLFDSVDFFLSDTGEIDFKEWTRRDSKQMEEPTRKTLLENKTWYRSKFKSHFESFKA